MSRIRILDETLSNQIAAGEVVERPASVAKELLENAVDAGATAITVDIAGGGVTRLRVVDNGHGMTAEEARLAVRRHATSKLSSAEQLSHIMTLGFRGEALPSIASVSRFRIRTRVPDAVGAFQLQIEGGRVTAEGEAAGPVGTEICVEDLFFNVPARRKFLKKPATETSHVQEAVQRMALCYPGVAFRFVREGKTLIDLPRHDTLLDRARGVFGKKLTADLREVASPPGAFAVDGLIGPPNQARATARHYHTFINGRFVRDRVIMSAVRSAYGTRLERGRHPFVILRLTLPPEAVDVNVHPAKTEVRFVDTSGIHRLVARALDEVIKAEAFAQPEPSAPPARTYGLSKGAPEAGLDAHRRRVFDVMERITARRGLGGPSAPPVGRPGPAHLRPVAPPPQQSLGFATPPMPAPVSAPNLPRLGLRPDLGRVALHELRPLGMVGELALCAAADGLVVLDPKAAQALLRYDRLRRGAEGRPAQPPLTLQLDASPRFETRRPLLATLGFTLSPFGGRTWALETLPEGLAPEDAEEVLRALLEASDGEPEGLAWQLAQCLCAQALSPRLVELPALLAALSKVEHHPPRPPRLAFALTSAELSRKLTPLSASESAD